MKRFIMLTIMVVTLSALSFGCSTMQPQPEIAQAYNERGMTELILGDDYEKALADFTQAIEFNPTDADSYVGRGLVYLKQGNAKAARKDFNKAASLNPDMKKALNSLLISVQATK